MGQMAKDTFVVLQANTPVRKAYEIVEGVEGITHVIVHSAGQRRGYYLFTRRQALNLLTPKSGQTPLIEALELAIREVTPILDAYADAEMAPDRSIVIQDEHLIGFVDYTEHVPESSTPEGGEAREAEPELDEKDLEAMGPSGPEPVSEKPVSRTLLTSFPEKVRKGTICALKVALSVHADAGPLSVVAKLGTQILIVVEPRSGFELDGEGEERLIITSEEETLPLRFKLKATSLGPGKIWVDAYLGVQPMGRLTILSTIVPATETVNDESNGEMTLDLIPAERVPPDLTLIIHQVTIDAQKGFQMRLAASDPTLELHFQPFPPVMFKKDPEAYFREFFEEVERITPENYQAAQLMLKQKGYHLFETFFPENLRILLWTKKDRIKTVRIVSDEPWIPWELCKLEGNENGMVQEGPFLCEAFAITRWLANIDPKPALTLNRMAVVVPDNSDLPQAPKECAYLQSLKSGKREVERITARFVKIINTLKKGKHDGWHFTGHGGFSEDSPDNSRIDLEDDEHMTPEDLSGPARNLGAASPLIFLNACQVGRSAMSLTGMGGWANGFLSAGAGAFIGAQWSIDDKIALEFAKEFYRQLLEEHQTIGEAVRRSRLKARKSHPGDSSWLAYTVYANPMAVVS